MLKKYSELNVGDVVKRGDTEVLVICKGNKYVRFADNFIYDFEDSEETIEVPYSILYESSLSSPSCQCKKEKWVEGDRYFTFDTDYNITGGTYEDDWANDIRRKELCLLFKSESEALSALTKVKELLKSIKENE